MLDDDEELDAEVDATDAVWVTCPYCGEDVELLIDVGGGEAQEYVEDCEVCCRPWTVRVQLGAEGTSVDVSTQDEE